MTKTEKHPLKIEPQSSKLCTKKHKLKDKTTFEKSHETQTHERQTIPEKNECSEREISSYIFWSRSDKISEPLQMDVFFFSPSYVFLFFSQAAERKGLKFSYGIIVFFWFYVLRCLAIYRPVFSFLLNFQTA